MDPMGSSKMKCRISIVLGVMKTLDICDQASISHLMPCRKGCELELQVALDSCPIIERADTEDCLPAGDTLRSWESLLKVPP